ncbi:MAG TPA: glycosyltransferase family 1 protein [Sedimentisphaerales bacterium]|nr:glycosyltransferase family 1 protein [Sedimentisphaerales bacterium]
MRIGVNFHSSDRYISGVEYYSLGLLNGLLNVDVRNRYVVFTNRPDLVREYVPSSENLQVVEIERLRTRAARIFWEQTRLPCLCARQGLEVLHCLSYICPVYRMPIPCIVTIHDTIAIDHPEWCKLTNAIYFNLFMETAAKKASCVIALSKCTADDLKRNFRLPCSRIRIVYPGIDSIFRTQKDSSQYSQVRTRYSLPDRYILYVGNIEPKKNIWTLLCVQRKIQQAGLPHKLVIAGKRAWGAEVELDEIARQMASNAVIRLGYVDRSDLPLVYEMADVFVFPSLYEGFGFPPLEAMACGTPVVSSSRGALRETVGRAALVVEPFNLEQITQAVISMIEDSSLREQHIRLGLRRSRLFNWEKAAQQTLSIYEEVLGAK